MRISDWSSDVCSSDLLRQRDGTVKRILVFFGGSDTMNQTPKAVEAIKQLKRPDIAVDVVVGGAYQHCAELQELMAGMPNIVLHRQVPYMAELVARADVGIGAGGAAMWERCYLGQIGRASCREGVCKYV